MTENQNVLQKLEEVRENALQALVSIHDESGLEEWRRQYLSRKAEVTAVMKTIPDLPKELRPKVGQLANVVKKQLEQKLSERQEAVKLEQIATSRREYHALAVRRQVNTNIPVVDVRLAVADVSIANQLDLRDEAIQLDQWIVRPLPSHSLGVSVFNGPDTPVGPRRCVAYRYFSQKQQTVLLKSEIRLILVVVPVVEDPDGLRRRGSLDRP